MTVRAQALIQLVQQPWKTVHRIRDTDAGGSVEEAIPSVQIPPGHVLLIDRVAVFTNGTYAGDLPEFLMYADDSDPQHLREYSPRGNRDVMDENSPIRFEPNEAIIVRWQGLDVGVGGGATATVTLQGRIVREILDDVIVGAPASEIAIEGGGDRSEIDDEHPVGYPDLPY